MPVGIELLVAAAADSVVAVGPAEKVIPGLSPPLVVNLSSESETEKFAAVNSSKPVAVAGAVVVAGFADFEFVVAAEFADSESVVGAGFAAAVWLWSYQAEVVSCRIL